MRVHHLAIQVADLETCSAFYREVLGLEPIAPPRPGVAWFRAGEAVLMLEPVGGAVHSEAWRNDRPGFYVLALAIAEDEREAWVERLGAANVPIEHRTAFTIYLRDPEGNRIGLSHYAV